MSAMIAMGRPPGRQRPRRSALLALPLLVLAAPLRAQDEPTPEYANDPTIGIEEKLGKTIPLDLTFRDESGAPVALRDLIDRPILLTLVYLRCPSICSPLLHEVARNVDAVDLVPGVDFRILTISFDVTDDAGLASTARTRLLAEMEREVPLDAWRFLTGEPDQIARLTDAVGFRFRRENQDFAHAGTVIFLSPKGRIVRYLSGLSILPADVKMAVIDAAEGRPRPVMQRLQRLCFAFDPEGKTYVLQVDRIVLAVTLPLIGAFLGFLLLKKRAVARS
ncbi:MAG: SCO family protein [Planctomycetota bacterium]